MAPPRQVYGKKRAHVFNHNIFLESPVRIKPRGTDMDELTTTVSKLRLESKHEGEPKHERFDTPRTALGEISTNSTRKEPQASPYGKPTKTSDLCEDEKPAPELTPQTRLRRISRPSSPSPQPERSQSRGQASPARDTREDLLHADHLGPLYSLCNSKLTPFAEFDASLSAHLEISKIAEASFSQVFMLSVPTVAEHQTPQTSVLKLIPLMPAPECVPKRKPKALSALLDLCSTPTNVASEIRLLQHLSPVPGFVNFRALHLLRGRPGPAFSEGCKAWNALQRSEGKEESHFPDPNKPKSYNDDQLWAVIEMQDAGSDLERLIETPEWGELGIAAVWDVFWQIVLAIGKAETARRFEHRDMHLGNICVNLNPHKQGRVKKHSDTKLGLTGLEATVIDYTISRAEIPSDSDDNEVAFFDLDEDPAIFEGDAAEEYQYEMYRMMRSAAFLNDPWADFGNRWEEAAASGRTWRGYHPQTNVVWLHFILCRLMENYQLWLLEEPQKSRKLSATEGHLCDVLTVVNELLEPERWATSGVRSAGDLVALALKRSWLDSKDVIGAVGQNEQRRPRTTTRHK